MKTIFTKILEGEIPSVKLHEDALCTVILDINPVHKGHLLVISREPYVTFSECPLPTLTHLMDIAQQADKKLRSALSCDGTNLLINNGAASGQEVPHLHIHIIPRYTNDGQKFGFTKETYAEGEMAKYGKQLEF
ncbi:MAG TPA: HIT family protein [Sphaerochaeta sp.]|nr:HIT family protein [Sphaerochaeta sp.]